jgi:hypothetical protein
MGGNFFSCMPPIGILLKKAGNRMMTNNNRELSGIFDSCFSGEIIQKRANAPDLFAPATGDPLLR